MKFRILRPNEVLRDGDKFKIRRPQPMLFENSCKPIPEDIIGYGQVRLDLTKTTRGCLQRNMSQHFKGHTGLVEEFDKTSSDVLFYPDGDPKITIRLPRNAVFITQS